MENLTLSELLNDFRREINYFRFDENYIINIGVKAFDKLFRTKDLISILQILLDNYNDCHTLRENTIYAIEDHLNVSSHV